MVGCSRCPLVNLSCSTPLPPWRFLQYLFREVCCCVPLLLAFEGVPVQCELLGYVCAGCFRRLLCNLESRGFKDVALCAVWRVARLRLRSGRRPSRCLDIKSTQVVVGGDIHRFLLENSMGSFYFGTTHLCLILKPPDAHQKQRQQRLYHAHGGRGGGAINHPTVVPFTRTILLYSWSCRRSHRASIHIGTDNMTVDDVENRQLCTRAGQRDEKTTQE